ncbi:MAG TPA: hypothetical protein VL528_09565, partial [Oxalicibacterium sp.]|nr:hypothetical protein [Oxalicibacterium sp.]
MYATGIRLPPRSAPRDFSKSCRPALQCSLANGKMRRPGTDCSHDEAAMRIDPVRMPLSGNLHQWLVLRSELIDLLQARKEITMLYTIAVV